MKNIYLREIRTYFVTMQGYAFVAVFLLTCGILFSVNNIFMDSDSYANVLLGNSYIMILICPALTMRLFAEERKNKSEQLLLSAPVRLFDIVIGKYLAALSVLGAALALASYSLWCLVYLGIRGRGSADGKHRVPVIGRLLISVGTFISSRTENQITCAVTTTAVLFALFLADAVAPSVPNQAISGFLSAISPFSALRSFRIGVVSPLPVACLLAFSGLFLFLTLLSLNARIWKRNGRHTKGGRWGRHSRYVWVVSVLTALIFSVGLVAANLLEKKWVLAADLSRSAVFSLSGETREMLDGLGDDVMLYGIYDSGSKDETVIQLLRTYEHYSDRVGFEMVDPVRQPMELQPFSGAELEQGDVIVSNAAKDRFRVLGYYDFYMTDGTAVSGICAEQSIASAIHYVGGGKQNRLLLATGQGELTPQTMAVFIADMMARGFSVLQID
jgi:ABC-2 type transport system permease protein